MTFIKDSAYIFSFDLLKPGEIIASYTPSKVDMSGKNIYKSLCIKREEIEFIKSATRYNNSSAVAVVCGKNCDSVAIFFTFFSFDTALGLVIKPHISAKDLAVVLKYGEFNEVQASPALLDMAPDGIEFLVDEYMGTFNYLVFMLARVFTMADLKFRYTIEYVELLRQCAEYAADFAGATVRCVSCFGSYEDAFREGGDIFDGRFCAASMLVFAMIAGQYAKDRTYNIDIIRGLQNLSVKFYFTARKDGWERALEYLRSIAADRIGISFEYNCSKNLVEATFFPFYADIGFVGVKERDSEISIVDFLEYF